MQPSLMIAVGTLRDTREACYSIASLVTLSGLTAANDGSNDTAVITGYFARIV